MPIFRGGDFLLVFFLGVVTGNFVVTSTTTNPGEGHPSRARSDLQRLGEFIAPGVWSGDRDWHQHGARGEDFRIRKKLKLAVIFDAGGAFYFFCFFETLCFEPPRKWLNG